MIALAITMVELGFWQLRRLHEKQDRRDVLRTELVADPVPLAQTPGPRALPTGLAHRALDGPTQLIGNRTLQEPAAATRS